MTLLDSGSGPGMTSGVGWVVESEDWGGKVLYACESGFGLRVTNALRGIPHVDSQGSAGRCGDRPLHVVHS